MAPCVQPLLGVGGATNIACTPNDESIEASAVVPLFYIGREACCPVFPNVLISFAPFRHRRVVAAMHQGSRLTGVINHVALVDRAFGL
eukprot:7846496-Pyramimonas_sp.AAC.1